MLIKQTLESNASGRSRGDSSDRSLRCFLILCASMFVNLLLAFANARGLPASSNLVTVVQATVTALAVPALFKGAGKLSPNSAAAMSVLLVFLLLNNVLNSFNIKTFYDIFLIPIYIALGASAVEVKSKWMNNLLLFVLGVTAVEAIAPSLYTGLFNPARYYLATRVWVEATSTNAASLDGFYGGAYRAGGSQFSFTDHRLSGPFLEPISLGYFAFLMSIYYAGVDRQSKIIRIIAIILCLGLALSADSRIPTVLITFSTIFLLSKWRLPSIAPWLIFPFAIGIAAIIYVLQPQFLYGDTFDRMAVTFDTLSNLSSWQIIAGLVPVNRAGDSGIIYLLMCVGPFGTLVAAWYFSGCYTRRSDLNVDFFAIVSLYIAVSLMFGGATLSIKTASLLGYLVGLVGHARRRAIN